MNKPQGYEEVQAFGDFVKLPKGGYVCKIMKMEEGKSQSSGADMLIIYLDIADGEYQGYFAERYRQDTRQGRKWGCIYRQLIIDSTTGNTNPRFKALMTAIEESNPGFVVDKTWGADFCKFYKDKLVGFVFGDEHYPDAKGVERTIAKPRFAVSASRIKKGDFTVPDDTYDNRLNNTAGNAENTFGTFEASTSLADGDMPF